MAPATGYYGGAAVTVAMGMGCRVVAAGRNTAKLSALSSIYENGKIRDRHVNRRRRSRLFSSESGIKERERRRCIYRLLTSSRREEYAYRSCAWGIEEWRLSGADGWHRREDRDAMLVFDV